MDSSLFYQLWPYKNIQSNIITKNMFPTTAVSSISLETNKKYQWINGYLTDTSKWLKVP